MDRIYKVWKNMSDISAIAALKFFYNDLKKKIIIIIYFFYLFKMRKIFKKI